MQTLQAYIDQKNKWNALFKGEQFTLSTAQGRQRIAQSIDADLSPENLSCDGELPRAEVARRHKMLTACALQLNKLDPVAAKAIYELYTGE
jgi:hypothetical protein